VATRRLEWHPVLAALQVIEGERLEYEAVADAVELVEGPEGK
jgi:hypothetical protein